MPNQSFSQAVIRGAAALKRGEEANWTLARLTYEHTRGQGKFEAAVSGEVFPMAFWCEAIREESGRRFSEATGQRYRRIWAKHLAENGTGTSAPTMSFAEAYAEVEGTPDRERMMQYEGTRLLERGTPQQKIEQASALLRDPDVREAALDIGTPIGGAVLGVSSAQKEHLKHQSETAAVARRDATERDPMLKGLDSARAIGDLTSALSECARRVAELLPRVDHLPPPDNDPLLYRHLLREAQARCRGAVEQVEDLLRTGKVGGGVEDFLKSVLGGDEGTK